MRNEFFAVTRTSIYQFLYDEETKDATVEKIYVKTESPILAGLRMIPLWTPIAIGRNIFWDDWHTSPISALFASLEEAKQCIESENVVDMDPRWKESTEKILNEIGDNHPAFYVNHAQIIFSE
ncbi:hypothetical protein C4565_02680 [Candidatus Parcubacteria bacterium]|jgi:hypothetical protein|nr:MAG: hypothetical protein C4565_02680 [Candidatus Parcubacteria bacterium]